MQSVRYGGRVAILGFPGRWEGLPTFNPLDQAWLWAKRLSVFGSGFDTRGDCQVWERRFTTRRNLETILNLLQDGTLKLAPLITHRVAAEKMQSIYELAASRSKDLITAVFHWEETDLGLA
jgi:threonine dehydrogenase-like Zn-dependent dehydrogenase